MHHDHKLSSCVVEPAWASGATLTTYVNQVSRNLSVRLQCFSGVAQTKPQVSYQILLRCTPVSIPCSRITTESVWPCWHMTECFGYRTRHDGPLLKVVPAAACCMRHIHHKFVGWWCGRKHVHTDDVVALVRRQDWHVIGIGDVLVMISIHNTHVACLLALQAELLDTLPCYFMLLMRSVSACLDSATMTASSSAPVTSSNACLYVAHSSHISKPFQVGRNTAQSQSSSCCVRSLPPTFIYSGFICLTRLCLPMGLTFSLSHRLRLSMPHTHGAAKTFCG